MYKPTEYDQQLIDEINEWCDVCFTLSMVGMDGLGGYEPTDIPTRFIALAHALEGEDDKFIKGSIAISSQFKRGCYDCT
jgi:hypothetical protein